MALIVMTTAGTGAISASADGKSAESSANQLVGSWTVNVDRGPLGPLKSLHTYNKGNTMTEISNLGAALRSPSHGAWERIDGHTYGVTSVFFRYAPTGSYAGTVKLRMTLELAKDGQSFTGVTVVEIRDTAGNLLPGSNTRRDLITGERIVVEPVPSLP